MAGSHEENKCLTICKLPALSTFVASIITQPKIQRLLFLGALGAFTHFCLRAFLCPFYPQEPLRLLEKKQIRSRMPLEGLRAENLKDLSRLEPDGTNAGLRAVGHQVCSTGCVLALEPAAPALEFPTKEHESPRNTEMTPARFLEGGCPENRQNVHSLEPNGAESPYVRNSIDLAEPLSVPVVVLIAGLRIVGHYQRRQQAAERLDRPVRSSLEFIKHIGGVAP
jgi:hypothetical protein